MSELHDDMGRGNLRKIWWLLTISAAMMLWFIASFLLYRFWYEDDLPTPKTLFNPLTNLLNILGCLVFAWLIMLPFRPRGDL
ncbi:hypothetical protein [Tautonia rosea]|uniref:hypothetical protein n=1 Tax=Tautonia rosea TaxID=2728037 RepID=UPI001473209C|nr:hypothetical protein [Tautonia rosea]